ncbi:MAG: hypothetical protein HN855_14635 [Anaerolineae bacterium]|jgi:hypothetical protein|nr:hypothetical protein [Anaerolineae bacterium]MBT7070888.1 hypothetical protein [Anaerolineae bacterium]MBT7326392.1 hypothetical protein [Anaerolineae bacterium]
MKTKLLTLFEKWANWKNILALFALQMLFNLVIMPSASSSDTHDIPILDLQFFYTPQRAYEIISAYTPELRQAAAMTRLTLDIIYPIVYGLMLTLLLVVTFRRAFPNFRFADAAVFLPWSGVLFDYLENFGLATMYLSYPTEFYTLAWITSVFTALKWTLIGLGFVLALIGGVKLAFVKEKGASHPH